ncbi:MAG TPA: PKD domain-containing protein, partial [Sphingobacteriaceae bacterium]
HKFVEAGNYTVTFAAYSEFGCASPAFSKPITIGAVPRVAYNFAGFAAGEPITFQSKSTVAGPNPFPSQPIVARLDWRFGDGGTKRSFVNDSVKTHQYVNPGIYKTSLIVTSTVGCQDTLYKKLIVVKKIVATDLTSNDDETFENADRGGWQPWNLADTANAAGASWKWGQPDGITITGTNNAWTTGSTTATPAGFYQPKEISALYTSAYDISALARPMVSFNSFVQLGQSDGVVLEYSTDSLNLADPAKSWKALGSLDLTTNISTGVDWYNKANLPSKPGKQDLGQFGWSETVDPDKDNIQEWIESKHSLGEIVKNNHRLVFRFALASVNDNPQLDGFALDNFRIGNRTRIVLLENFRNLGNTATDTRGIIEKAEADSISSFNPSGVATSVVRINYHVAFPAADPFNGENNQDPGARALYYNISQTPRARMDGQFPADALFSTWGENFYNIRSLKLADAIITPTVSSHPDGSGSVSINVKALRDLGPETILNVALVEQSIDLTRLSTDARDKVKTQENVFEYVLKRLIPNASGTRFGSLLAADDDRDFTQNLTWTRDFT